MATPAERADRAASGQQIAIVVVLLLVLLGVLWFTVLRGGGGGGEDEALPLATPTADEGILPEIEPGVEPEEPVTGPGRGPIETFEVFAPRDPFLPLIAAQATGGGTTGGATDDGATGGGGAGDDGGANGNGNGGGAPSTASGGDVGGHTVKMVDSFNRNGREVVQVQVDGTVYTVSEGETFAQNFQVVSIDGECASFLFGDDQFTLCEGEEILK